MDKSSRRKRAKREVQDETVDVMNEMYKKKIATIMERKVDSRANASILERLVALQLARPSPQRIRTNTVVEHG